MSSIKDQLVTLVNLQKAENSIQIMENKLAVVDDRIRKMDQEVLEFKNKVDGTQEQHNDLKKKYREDEGEVKSIEDQIELSNVKLRSVKTNKEYQSMLKEIDELRKKKSSIEDQMITALDKIEISEKEIDVLNADLADLSSETQSKKEEIRDNALGQRDELETSKTIRDGIFEELDLKIQSLYKRVKQQNGGIGVAGVLDGVCQVCRMNIPPQLFIELMRMQSLLMCPNCQRIIYPQSLIEEEKAQGQD
jgi:predicted  nucleic acid-binding Zn-ribbon protein